MIKVKGVIEGLEIDFEGEVEDFIKAIESIKGKEAIYIPYTPQESPYNPNDGNMWFSTPEITCDSPSSICESH